MRTNADHEPYHVDGIECIGETENMIHVTDHAGWDEWIHKKYVDEDSEVNGYGDEGCLVVPTWYAEKLGL
jgi:hypothetical protein